MNSLFDFITHIKTVEYLMAVGAIALYILYWEVLKPKPFKSLVEAGREDVDHIRKTGYKSTLKIVGKVMAAPFIGLAYIVFLPFTFAYALASMVAKPVLTILTKEASFGWRPIEAYLSGRKKKKKEDDSARKDEKQ
jgi:hypothetical protein